MERIIGNYKNTQIGIIDGQKKISILNFPWRLTYDNINLIDNRTGINNGYKGFRLVDPPVFKGGISYAHLETAPIPVVQAVAGNITNGTHVYVSTYVTTGGEESITSPLSIVANASTGYGQVLITPPLGPSGTAYRKVYRSLAGTTTPLYFVANSSDNGITNVVLDNLSDATITATTITPPTISNNYDFDYSVIAPYIPAVNSSDWITVKVDIPDETQDLNFNVQKTVTTNPDSEKYIDPYDPVALSNVANAATNDFAFELKGYSYHSFHVKMATTRSDNTMTMTIYASNNDAAVEGSLTGWVDITTELLKGDVNKSVTNATFEDIILIDDQMPLLKIMFRFVSSGGYITAENTVNVYTMSKF